MKKYISNLAVKIKLFYPLFTGFIIVMLLVILVLINRYNQMVYTLAEESLLLEVQTVKKMFERERELKLEKVLTDLRIAHKLFFDQQLKFSPEKLKVSAKNQFSGSIHDVLIETMKLDGKLIYRSLDFPDSTFKLVGGTTTIFQKIDSGFMRISTNVLDEKGEAAVGTYIPFSSPVVQTIEKGETYYGRAFVVNEWYITAYEPVFYEGKLKGMLYVGDKEKDLDKLTKILNNIKIGQSGYIFVLDDKGNPIIQPEETKLFADKEQLLSAFSTQQEGVIRLKKISGTDCLLAWNYYSEFGFYIVALVPQKELTAIPIRSIIVSAVIIGLISAILFALIILTTTTRRVHRLLNAIRLSNVKLQTAQAELVESKENFQTLFNNSSDDIFVSDINLNIIEVNQVACDSLGYSRDELLKMSLKDIKSERYRAQVSENRKIIMKQGSHTFESEHLTKSGEIYPVEIKSRLFEYKGQKAVLAMARNITERKEIERKVLSAVITTEERERERFAKDMHDGLGPLLSTIKLYVNELNTEDSTAEEKESFIKEINKMLDEAVASTREISNNLMPRVIKEYGLVKAIESFCQKVNKTGKVDIHLENNGINENLDRDLQLILFRVISELINNSLKHAQAKNIQIRLAKVHDHISLAFEDDGIGFNMSKVMNNKQTGIGLKSIISRVKSVNGRVIFKSMEGYGFKIYIDI